MDEMKKSDSLIVVTKGTNKGASASAESLERRGGTKGNSIHGSTRQTQSWERVSQAVERVRIASKRGKEKMNCLLPHVHYDSLYVAYFDLKKKASAGVDHMTWDEYGRNLKENLEDLVNRIHTGAYRAMPVLRVEIPKPDGGTRYLGIPVLEDKIVQKAVGTLLNAVYEEKFLGLSYGFRPERSAHDALDALAYGIERKKISYIIDADIRSYFDSVERELLVEFLEHEIGDKRLIRLIRKWLNCGVMDQGLFTDSGFGTPQGAVISPLLSNVYLHYVLDLWANNWRNDHAKGDMILIRYADDFVAGFQHKAEADKFLSDLKDRFQKFSLEIHPGKTRLIEFGRFAASNRIQRGQGRPETFDFLGFTHFCTITRKGRFRIGRKPISKRVSRKLQALREQLKKLVYKMDQADIARWLGRVLKGWSNYFAVPGTIEQLLKFRRALRNIWMKYIRRRSQRGSRFSWERLERFINIFWPRTRIVHPWPTARFAMRHNLK